MRVCIAVCLGTILLLSSYSLTEGKVCLLELTALSHSTLTCITHETRTNYTVDVTVEKTNVTEVCKVINGTSNSTTNSSTNSTDTRRRRRYDNEVWSVPRYTRDTVNSSTNCTNVSTIYHETVKESRVNTTYTTVCYLTCEEGYTFNANPTQMNLSQTCNNDTGRWSGQTSDNYFGKWSDVCTKQENPVNRTTNTIVHMVPTTGSLTSASVCPESDDDNLSEAFTKLESEKTALLPCLDEKSETCEREEDAYSCELVTYGEENKYAFKMKVVYSLDEDMLNDTLTMVKLNEALVFLITSGAFQLEIEPASDDDKRRKKRSSVTYVADTTNYTSVVEYACEEGYGKIGEFCSECPQGYFLDASNNECTVCPKGTYTDEDALLNCKVCPDNTTTFVQRSDSANDCITECEVKDTINGTEDPAAGWNVNSEHIIRVECDPGHSLPYKTSDWYKCSDETPHCFAKCVLDQVPANVMLLPNDTTETELDHLNYTVVACIDFINFHNLTCNNGNLDWPKCDDIELPLVGNRIYMLFLAVLVLAVVILICFVISQSMTYRSMQQFKGGNYAAVHTNMEDPLNKPIISLPLHVEEFSNKVATYNRGGKTRWEKEFKQIPTHDPQQTRSIALASYNRRKNKENARAFVPYDVSRVKVGKDDEYLLDYYNASYVNGWKGPRAYITAQTPLQNTKDDFWKILLEHNCRIMINFHQSAEELPTEYYKYWPEEEGLYDDILVRKVAQTNYSGFLVRHFRIGPVEWPESEEEEEEVVLATEEETEEVVAGEDETSAVPEDEAGETNAEEEQDEEAEEEEEEEGEEEEEEAEEEEAEEADEDDEGEEDEDEEDEEEEDDGLSVAAKSTKSSKTVKSTATKSVKSAKSAKSKKSAKYSMELSWMHSFVVKQIQFTAWDENDEPDMAKLLNMVYFYREISKFNLAKKSPLLVHSDYGSDWASVFCAIDYLFDRLIGHTDINIAGLTNAMRQQRPMMIASLEEYIFLHNFIDYVITSDSYEDMKYVGFKMDPNNMPDPTPPTEDSESLPATSTSESEYMVRSVRNFSRAASRAVEDGTKSVAKSVASVAKSIFTSVKEEEAEDLELSSIQEEEEEEAAAATETAEEKV